MKIQLISIFFERMTWTSFSNSSRFIFGTTQNGPTEFSARAAKHRQLRIMKSALTFRREYYDGPSRRAIVLIEEPVRNIPDCFFGLHS